MIPLAKRLAKFVMKESHPVWSVNAALAKRSRLFRPMVVHIGERGWVLNEVRNAISRPLSKHYTFMPARISEHVWSSVRNSIVHFGTTGRYVRYRYHERIHPSNWQVLTWTHGQRSNPNPVFAQRLDSIGAVSSNVDKIITISKIGENILLSEGVDRNKVCHIPLGIDTRLFTPPTPVQRTAMRRALDIPDDALCIGSFQKDGEGWDDGMSPKWVKGPDVFLQVVDRLRNDFNLCILLTGPARGYVKAGLERMGVPYRHVWLKRYQDVARHFWALDLYVIASRDEGGPMAVLESMASGVPLVSTRVGMSVDLVSNGVNGYLSEVEDSDDLAASASKLIESPSLRASFSREGVTLSRCHDWSAIAVRYHEQVYRPMLVEDGYKFLR